MSSIAIRPPPGVSALLTALAARLAACRGGKPWRGDQGSSPTGER